MVMMICPAYPNMNCIQNCCCAVCKDEKRDRCNSMCGFWKKGQKNVRENLINKSIKLANKLDITLPDFQEMTLEQVANYHESLKSRNI